MHKPVRVLLALICSIASILMGSTWQVLFADELISSPTTQNGNKANSSASPGKTDELTAEVAATTIIPSKVGGDEKAVSLSMSLPGQARYNVVLPPANEPYVLGPGDQLNIVDYSFADADKPPVNTHVVVLPDGTATIYPLGPVNLLGMTVAQLNALLNKSHTGTPEIFASVSKARPVSVRILGDVVSPGVYTTEAGLFTSKVGIQPVENIGADDTNSVPLGYTAMNQVTSGTYTSQPPRVNQLSLITALQLAGGVHESADISNVRVTRAFTGKPYFVDLWRLVSEGDISQDIPIRDGDTIFVSRGGATHDMSQIGMLGERTRRVRVIGAVKKPGVYDMRPDDDLFSAIAKAGGYTDTAIISSVILTRKTPQGTIKTQSVPMPRKNMLNMIRDKGESIARLPVRNGDVIVVTESAMKKFGPRAVTGLSTLTAALGVVFLNSRVNKP